MKQLRISLKIVKQKQKHEVIRVNHLPRMDKFDRTVVAIIGVTAVVLFVYIFLSSAYNNYLSHHYVAYNENETEKFIEDWRQYSSEGHVMHVVLYDKSKASDKHQSQIVSFMTKKYEKSKNMTYKPITVDMTNEDNQKWVKESNIKGVSDNPKYPVSLTFTKDGKGQTHIDIAQIRKDMSKSQVNMLLERYK